MATVTLIKHCRPPLPAVAIARSLFRACFFGPRRADTRLCARRFGGALSSFTTDPGWRWVFPGLYSKDFVQLTLQTDYVRDVPCGTSTGVIIIFDRIEVVNQLDRSKAHSTIKRFGTNYDKVSLRP